MQLRDLNKHYDTLQKKYGAKELHSIYNGGCTDNPDICFVFMNPTGKNIASLPNWEGEYYPWLGTKGIWDLFYAIDLLDEDIYKQIKSIKGSEWTPDFSNYVYEDIKRHKVFITNLAKCTQVDARPLNDSVFMNYLKYLLKEIEIVNPKVVVLFGNQVSSIVLNEKISVSQVRRKPFSLKIKKNSYLAYSVYYPIGNGRFNIDKTIEDLKWIIEQNLK